MANKFANVYQFKITLKGITPKIWRRIQVPENYTFWDLHIAIQNAMGWSNYHMYEFSVLNQHGEECRIGIDDEMWEDDEVTSCHDEVIADYFSPQNKRALYTYDFGDNWQHEILFEKVLPVQPETQYPICIAGKRACPPEDCGGIWGYEELLEIIQDPYHDDHASMLEWVGGKFDPEEFDCKKVHFNNSSAEEPALIA
ncbi:MAG: plasmid pRiA4b ORF-3 family protein [Pseudomonadota bacterium]